MEEIVVKCSNTNEEIVVSQQLFNTIKKNIEPSRKEWDECLVKLKLDSPDWDD